jgi:VPDSG-CTERM motif
MKALPRKLLPLALFAIATTWLFSVSPVQAYTVRLHQVGSNVVATGSGPINLTGLTFRGSVQDSDVAAIVPNPALIFTGSVGLVNIDVYHGLLTGPTNFGSGLGALADTGSGDFVGINVFGGNLFVPQGYVSGSALSDSMTFNNATFVSLGATPGTYVWTWGQGANQRFTLIIGGAGVPDGGSTVSLLGFGLLSLAALRRKLSC